MAECGHSNLELDPKSQLVRCKNCAMWMPSGLCLKCPRAIDDHLFIGTPQQQCPPPVKA